MSLGYPENESTCNNCGEAIEEEPIFCNYYQKTVDEPEYYDVVCSIECKHILDSDNELYEPLIKYKVEVRVKNESGWLSNALTFNTRKEAETYAINLALRWSNIEECRIVTVN